MNSYSHSKLTAMKQVIFAVAVSACVSPGNESADTLPSEAIGPDRSGTRIHITRPVFLGDDGSKLTGLPLFFDTKLATSCIPTLIGDIYRCIPEAYPTSYFMDSGCRYPVAWASCSQKILKFCRRSSGSCGSTDDFFRVGALIPESDPIYQLYSTGCLRVDRRAFPSGSTFFECKEPVESKEFPQLKMFSGS